MKRLALIAALLVLSVALAAPAAAQIPPTPTPMGPGIPHFTMPDSFSLWAGTSTAIQFWNWVGDGRVVVQALALISLVIAGMFIVWKFIKQSTRRDSES